MKILMVGFSNKGPKGPRDNAWLGNTATVARLYKGRKLVGQCIDTPNAIACAARHVGASRVIDGFGEPVAISPDRLAAGGWMQLGESGFIAA